ncbi:MAG TPA: hypothetical protein PLD36_07090, partial [Bacteroidia bacterium]|nr:hypothetical protein [Bacteroidia bacterium]
MYRIYLICSLLFLSYFADAQAGGKWKSFQVYKGDTINRLDLSDRKQGIWKKYYRTDTLCAETFFMNNIPVGRARTWYES